MRESSQSSFLLLLPLLLSPQILAVEQIEKEGVIRFVRGNEFDPGKGEPTGVELLSDGKIIPTYLALKYHGGRWICGKYAPHFGLGYFDFWYWDEKEASLDKSQIYVLEAPPGTIRWVKTNRWDSDRKEKTWFMCGGKREPSRYMGPNSAQTYPCRYADDNGNLLTGYILSHGSGGQKCTSTFGGKVHRSGNDLEYAVWTEYGKAMVQARKKGWLKKYGKE